VWEELFFSPRIINVFLKHDLESFLKKNRKRASFKNILASRIP
jgi:hypothetical protein